MRLFIIIGSAVLLAVFAGCAGDQILSDIAPAALGLGPLPGPGRHASATQDINGADFFATGPGATVSDTSLVLDPGADTFTYAIYGAAVPAGGTLQSVSITLDQLMGEYWVAFSDYGVTGRWELHGPYTETAPPIPPAFNNEPANYLNVENETYWAVIVPALSSLTVIGGTVNYDIEPIFHVPPSGMQTISATPSLAPGMLLMTETDYAESGAPVIAFTQLEDAQSKLYLAHYHNDSWKLRQIAAERSFTQPRLVRLEDDYRMIVFDATANALVDLQFDPLWELTGEQVIMDGPGPAFFGSSADSVLVTDGETVTHREFGVAHSYVGTDAGQVYFSWWTEAGGWQSTAALHDSDIVMGITMRYDPVDHEPWLIYSHGTINLDSTILVDSSLEYGRRNGGAWTFTSGDITIGPDNTGPLLLDLTFAEDNTPLLLASVTRDYSITIPVSFTASLMIDAVVGEYTGSAWDYQRVFESSVGISLIMPPFPPDSIRVTLSVAPEVYWANSSELLHTKISGSVDLLIDGFEPTGSDFAQSQQYMTGSGGSYESSGYFTGDDGNSFSWDDVGSGPSCAYIRASDIAYEDILSGEFAVENDLLYWSP